MRTSITSIFALLAMVAVSAATPPGAASARTRVDSRLKDAGGNPVTSVIVCLGNSLTYGSGAQTTDVFGNADFATNRWSTQMFNSLPSQAGILIFNQGHAGLTSAQLSTLVPTEVTPRYNSVYARKICIVQEGTNTLVNTRSPSTTLSDYKSLCLTCRNIGYYVIALTVPSFASAGVNQGMIDTVNTEIKNGANLGVYWDVVVDIAAHPGLGAQMVDNFHFNATGYSFMAADIRAVIQPLLP